MGRGHGGSRGSGPSGGVSDRTMRGYSSTLAKAIGETESTIRTNTSESIHIFTEQGEKILGEAGKATTVALNVSDIPKLQNNIMTHNHPTGTDFYGRPVKTTSFSKTDVVSAVRYNSKEYRAAAEGYTFSMKRPDGGWGHSYRSVSARYDRIYKSVFAANQKYINSYGGDKRTAASRAIAVTHHAVMKQLSKELGFSYTKQRVN